MRCRFVGLVISLLLVAAVPPVHAADEAKGGKMPMMKESKEELELKGTLLALEHKLWDAFKSRDAKSFLSATDEHGWMVDMNGFAPFSMIGEMMKEYELRSYRFEDVHVTMASKDVAILSYTAHADGSYQGQAMPDAPSYTSSVFAMRNGKWVGVYHQETPAMPESEESD